MNVMTWYNGFLDIFDLSEALERELKDDVNSVTDRLT